MPDNLFIKPEVLEQIRSTIHSVSPEAIVWAYGSRVTGDFHDGSDLDLAVIEGDVVQIKIALQESDIPFLIDVLDFHSAPESFRGEIEKNHIVITS